MSLGLTILLRSALLLHAGRHLLLLRQYLRLRLLLLLCLRRSLMLGRGATGPCFIAGLAHQLPAVNTRHLGRVNGVAFLLNRHQTTLHVLALNQILVLGCSHLNG